MAIFGTYRLRVDWDGNGSFANAYSILTPFVRQAGVTVEYGRDRASMLVGRSTAGKLTAELDNSSRVFSRFWASSPLTGKLLPGRAVDYSVSTDGGATWQVLFTGRLSALETDLTPLKQDYRARLTATGPIGWINRDKRVAVPLMSSIPTGTAMNYILDSLDWPTTARSIEQGQSTMLRYYVRDTAALTALRDLEDTEGGFLRETRDGKLAFEDRSHRYKTPWNTPRATYTCLKTGAIRYAEIHPIDSLSDVYTVMQAKVRTFNLTTERDLVRVTDLTQTRNTINYITLPPGQVVQIDCVFPPPNGVFNELAVGLWSTVIIKATANNNGTGADLSSSIQFVDGNNTPISSGAGNLDYGKFSNGRRLRMRNTGTVTAYAVTLTCRGYAVIEGAGYQVSLEDAAAIAKYGRATYNYPGKYLTSMSEAQGLCQYNLDRYKEPRNAVRMTMVVNAAQSHLVEAAAVDVSDRIRIQSWDGLAGDYYVEKIRHVIKDNCQHTVTLECTEAYGTTWAPSGEPYNPREIESVPMEDLPGYIEDLIDDRVGAITNPLRVNAGLDQVRNNITTWPQSLVMAGSYSGGTAPVSVMWSVVSGTGVTMTGANTLTPNVSFSAAGMYILRLTATDGNSVVAYDDVRIDMVAAVQSASSSVGVFYGTSQYDRSTAGAIGGSLPAGDYYIIFHGAGGGGAGGVSNADIEGGGEGGGEGEWVYLRLSLAAAANSFSGTLGAGGAGGVANGNMGGAGASSALTIGGTTYTAAPGRGGRNYQDDVNNNNVGNTGGGVYMVTDTEVREPGSSGTPGGGAGDAEDHEFAVGGKGGGRWGGVGGIYEDTLMKDTPRPGLRGCGGGAGANQHQNGAAGGDAWVRIYKL